MISLKKYVNKSTFPVSLLNINKIVGKNQNSYIFSIANIANKIKGNQKIWGINAFNYAKEVGETQVAGANAFNYAKEVGEIQWALFNGANIAKEVKENQIAGANVFNYAEEVGEIQWALFNGANIANKIKDNQKTWGINAFNYAKEVGRDQGAGANVFNYAEEVGRDQGAVIFTLLNYAKEVGENQGSVFNAFNYAEEVGRDQGAVINGANIAKEVGRDQGAVINGANIAKEVGRDQGPVIFTLLNYANKAKKQKNALVNITKSTGTKQKGVINYSPLTGINLWQDLPSKINSAKKKFEKKYLTLEDNIKEEVINDLANSKQGLIKSLFNYNTKRNLVKREARKYLMNNK
ncbi:hypothetical protein KAI04_00210 [Candidatus Pacearchaeota archaeon]|nr:hypothetical protein [Candidatus Pacearchaeota archaeon]